MQIEVKKDKYSQSQYPWKLSVSHNGFQWWTLSMAFRRKQDAVEAKRGLMAIVKRGDAV